MPLNIRNIGINPAITRTPISIPNYYYTNIILGFKRAFIRRGFCPVTLVLTSPFAVNVSLNYSQGLHPLRFTRSMPVQCCVTRWRWYRVNAECPKYTLDIVYSKSDRRLMLNNGGPIIFIFLFDKGALSYFMIIQRWIAGISVSWSDSSISFLLFKLYCRLVDYQFICATMFHRIIIEGCILFDW